MTGLDLNVRKAPTFLRVVISLGLAAASLLLVRSAEAQYDGWTVPPTGPAEKSPLTATPDVLKKGKALYTSHCQRCHGREGEGDGPDGDSKQRPADLTDSYRARLNPDGAMFYKVWNGRKSPDMPAFKSELTKDEVWAVVEYAKSLRKP